MEVLTYVPSLVTMLINGYQIEGWNSISIQKNVENFKQVRGIRGKNTRIRNKDTSAVITVTCPQTEYVNEVLSRAVEVDMLTGNARLEITLKDGAGATVFSTTTAYVAGWSDVSYGTSLSDNSWKIFCDESKVYVAGARNPASGIISDGIGKLTNFVKDLDVF